MFTTLLTNKAIPYILSGILIIGTGWYVYSTGSKHGSAKIQTLWDVDKAAHNKAMTKLKDEYASKEIINRAETIRITHELSETNKQYEVSLANLRNDYSKRLLDSDQRADVYKRQAEAGTTECGNLAIHAARLDKSLEQGRDLVREFRTTLRQREDQLRLLGQQLLNDRSLIGEESGIKNGNEAISTK